MLPTRGKKGNQGKKNVKKIYATRSMIATAIDRVFNFVRHKMDKREVRELKSRLSKKSFGLLKRFYALRSSKTTKRGNRYLEHPTLKDTRWGESNPGGIWPITLNRAEKLITQMEKQQQI